MSKIWMPGGGGGIDLDVVTATSPDILSGKVIVDKDGNPLTGSMPDNKAVAPPGLNAGGQYIIPLGYHNGSGKVVANSLASQTPGNISPNLVRNGYVYWSNGVRGVGTMPDYSSTPTPINNIRLANNRFEVAVAAGYHGEYWAAGAYEYMSLSQVANTIGLTPAKLKKNEVVCGVTGTFEGWVPTANDLYVRGNNIAGFIHTIYGRVNYEAGGMQLLSDSNNRGACLHELSAGNIDYTKYNYLNIEGYYERRGIILPSERNLKFNIRIKDSASGQALLAEAFNVMPANYTNFTTSLYIGPLALSRSSYIDLGVSGEYYYSGDDGNYWQSFNMSGWLGWVYRIWLS